MFSQLRLDLALEASACLEASAPSLTGLPRAQSQHQGEQKGTWRCYCGKEGTTNTLEFWHKPSKVVKNHTEGFLKADLFREWNPVEPEEAEEREAELAAHLRKQGYGIWAGHHDKKKS